MRSVPALSSVYKTHDHTAHWSLGSGLLCPCRYCRWVLSFQLKSKVESKVPCHSYSSAPRSGWGNSFGDDKDEVWRSQMEHVVWCLDNLVQLDHRSSWSSHQLDPKPHVSNDFGNGSPRPAGGPSCSVRHEVFLETPSLVLSSNRAYAGQDLSRHRSRMPARTLDFFW